ncbi:MAG TPA: hypothetical protein VL614_00390 [Acetobacteraceae bacterium]|jgi:hypothetical protein|nr:hypothetical protein [Acetobacteraceae bacterium]
MTQQTQQPQDTQMLPAMVTLTVADWGRAIQLIGVNPWNDVNTLIVNIHRQVNDAVGAQTSREPERATSD